MAEVRREYRAEKKEGVVVVAVAVAGSGTKATASGPGVGRNTVLSVSYFPA